MVTGRGLLAGLAHWIPSMALVVMYGRWLAGLYSVGGHIINLKSQLLLAAWRDVLGPFEANQLDRGVSIEAVACDTNNESLVALS